MRRILILACVAMLAGCRSSEPDAARAFIQAEHGGDPVSFVKVWPAVPMPAGHADKVAAELKAAGTKTDHRSNMLFVAYVALADKPDSVMRAQYRAPDKEGKNVLRDVLVFLKEGRAVMVQDLGKEPFRFWLEEQGLRFQ